VAVHLIVAMLLVGLGSAEAQRPPRPPAAILAQPDRPGWTVDARNGCWVWNADPHPDQVVVWNGPCPRGPAEGPGSGEWRNPRHGLRGVDRFSGVMRNGRLEGQGTYVWSYGDRYEGEWRNGRRDGRGTFTTFRGGRLEGEFREDRANGPGIYIFPDGRRYEGSFVDDQRSGLGVLTWPDGRRLEGEFRNDRANGQGILTWLEGSRYEGGWRDDFPHGEGEYRSAQDGVLRGTWEGGCFRDGARRVAIGRPVEDCH
jgi:hypothetical protein